MLAPSSATHCDSYRAETEDRIALFQTAQSIVIAVADGVGGRANGGPAADFTIGRVGEHVASPRQKERSLTDWQRLVERLDRELFGNETCGETTLVVAEIFPTHVIGVSVGDSEAWLVRPGGHFDLTSRQIAKPFLGSGAATVVPFHVRNPRSGTLLAATDGLFKYATTRDIESAALAPDLMEALKTLGELPRLRSGSLPDDLAIGAFRLGSSPAPLGRAALLSRWLGEAPWLPALDNEEV